MLSPGGQYGKPQDFLPKRFVLGDQKGNEFPPFRLHDPTEEEFRCGEFLDASGKQFFGFGKPRQASLSVGEAVEAEAGIGAIADAFDEQPGESVDGHHPPVVEDRHVLPG